jgi:hypothetical protein
MRTRLVVLCCLVWPCSALAFKAGGFDLGDSEAAVKAAYPSAYCRPLEWKSDAADRRCDDARITFAGARSRITAYLKNDSVQAFDIRFDASDYQNVAAQLRLLYGKPGKEGKESVRRGDRPAQEIYKMRWAKGQDRATYTAHPGARRSQLSVWRGNFESEIYRVR